MPTPAAIPSDARLSLTRSVVSTSIPGETVILDPTADRYFSLEGVGNDVWEMLQRGTTVASIVATIEATYDVDPATCERDVRALLGNLTERGLLIVEGATP